MAKTTRPPRKPVLLAACLALMAAWCLLALAGQRSPSLDPTDDEAGPRGHRGAPVVWSPATLTASVPPGGRITRQMTFTTGSPLRDVRIAVVPALAAYLHLSPEFFPLVPSGEAVTVTATFSVPEGLTPTTIDGVVRLVGGPRTIPRPLPVMLEIIPPTCDARSLLFSRRIAAADDCLATTLARDPADQEANFFRAITRILRIVEERGPGADPSSYTDSLQEMLDRFGALVLDRDPFGFDVALPSILPDDAPTGGDLQEFLGRVLLPALDGAIDENLSRIDQAFTITVTPEELAGLGVLQGAAAEVDYGDAGVLRAGLAILRGFLLHLLLAHDLNIDIDAWRSMRPESFQRDVLDRYPDLLNLVPDGAAVLGRSKASYLDGIDAYFAASSFIRHLDDPYQFDDVIAIEGADLEEEERLRSRLGAARCALLGGSFLRLTDQGVECTAGPIVVDATPVNPAPFFDHPAGLRGLLPPISFDEVCGKNFIDAPSPTATFPFPDPSAGGLFPSMTQDDLVRRMEVTPRLRSSPAFLYALPGGTTTGGTYLLGERRRFSPGLRVTGVHLERGEVFSLSGLPPVSPENPLVFCRASGYYFLPVRFSPPVAGSYTDTIVVRSNDPESPHRIKVFGCGEHVFYTDCDQDGVPTTTTTASAPSIRARPTPTPTGTGISATTARTQPTRSRRTRTPTAGATLAIRARSILWTTETETASAAASTPVLAIRWTMPTATVCAATWTTARTSPTPTRRTPTGTASATPATAAPWIRRPIPTATLCAVSPMPARWTR